MLPLQSVANSFAARLRGDHRPEVLCSVIHRAPWPRTPAGGGMSVLPASAEGCPEPVLWHSPYTTAERKIKAQHFLLTTSVLKILAHERQTRVPYSVSRSVHVVFYWRTLCLTWAALWVLSLSFFQGLLCEQRQRGHENSNGAFDRRGEEEIQR